MKKISVIICSLIFLFTMTSCVSQDKMNPMIFVGRLKDNFPEISVSEIYREDNGYFCFLTDENNINFALKFYTDHSENIKKICLACNIADKTDSIKFISEALIATYASDENTDDVVKYLFINERDYYNTQWYRYASVIIEGKAFFSVENMKISTASDAQLTLKPNDITFRE